MDLGLATEFGRIFALQHDSYYGQKYSFGAQNVVIFGTRVHKYTV